MPIRLLRYRSSIAGFSLVEMLVAVAVMALIGSAGILAMGNQDRARVSKAAAEMSLLLAQARRQAVLEGRPQTVRIDETGLEHAGLIAKRPAGLALEIAGGARRIGEHLVLSPDGSSAGLLLKLEINDQLRWLNLDPLTGWISVSSHDPASGYHDLD